MKDIYTTVEAAELLGVHKLTVIRWCRSGRLPGAYLKMRSRKLGWQIPADSITALQTEGSAVQDALQR